MQQRRGVMVVSVAPKLHQTTSMYYDPIPTNCTSEMGSSTLLTVKYQKVQPHLSHKVSYYALCWKRQTLGAQCFS